jgi:branched-chain amino acid transport system substrate-binding protein
MFASVQSVSVKKMIIGATVFTSALFLSGCTLFDNNKIDENGLTIVKIGVISPLSGDAASYGEQMSKILETHINVVNEKAKAKKYKFELVQEDGKCTGSTAVSAYQKLKDIDGVQFMIAGFCSSESLAIAPLTKYGDVLALSPSSSNPDIEGASPYLYSLSYSDEVTGATLAELMGKYKKVAIITEQIDYSIGIKNVFEREMVQNGNTKIVANEIFPTGATDVRNLLEKIKQSNPDAILLNPMGGTTAKTLTRQFAEITDWGDVDLYGGIAYIEEETLKIAPNVTNGMTVVDSPNLTNKDLLEIKANIEKEKGSLSSLGVFFTASSMDALNILSDAIIENGENVDAVKTALTSKKLNGYVGEIDFTNGNFAGIKGGVYTIINSKPVYQD